MIETTIPFSGFYESLHDDAINRMITDMFSDRDTGTVENGGLEYALWKICNFRKVHAAYAKFYCECFAFAFDIPSLKFEELDSPREYNFTTDKIIANITLKETNRLLKAVDKKRFIKLAYERFTSREGFCSFYNPDPKEWGPLSTWDANQVGTILQAYADENSGKDGFDPWAEFGLVEDLSGSGQLDNWVCDATPGIERLFKIHNYLERRAARETNQEHA